jgi:hypothetical protein
MNFNVRLIKVEDHFLIEGRGLLVAPLIDLPEACRNFKPFSTEIMVKRPNQSHEIFTVKFQFVHISLIGGGCKWEIAVMMPDATKDTVPIGSTLFINEEDNKKLKGELPNE